MRKHDGLQSQEHLPPMHGPWTKTQINNPLQLSMLITVTLYNWLQKLPSSHDLNQMASESVPNALLFNN